MDPIYLLQASIFSKIINNPDGFQNIPIYGLFGFSVYILYRMIPYKIIKYIETIILEKWFEKDESSIIIPYHIKIYSSGLKPIERTLYSERFHAITYHIIKYHLCDFSSMTENIQFENSNCYYDNGSDFILLPKHTNKIQITHGDGHNDSIFFEVILEHTKSSDDDDNLEKDCKTTGFLRTPSKKYIYKLSKPGKHSLESIHVFIEGLVKTYKEEVINKPIQYNFEYISTIKDDDDKVALKIKESPFHTNKTFQNIFFERKTEFIQFISKFNSLKKMEKMDIEYRESIKKEYRRIGNPYKATIMLYGPPGCGKTSLIKATAEYTGRHCVLVSWTKIKTCTDFVSLFRPLKIGYKEYNPSELIIVFEDFDANACDILKTRANLKEKNKFIEFDTCSDTSVEFEDFGKDPVKNQDISLKQIKKQLDKMMNPTMSFPSTPDELTLDYILNILDGIAELHDSIIFFTTNDIESIDPALKRPGRIDLILKMERISHKMIRELLEYRYKCVLEENVLEKLNKIHVNKYSYAEICEFCNINDSVEGLIEKLII
jgi:hypothetical protein